MVNVFYSDFYNYYPVLESDMTFGSTFNTNFNIINKNSEIKLKIIFILLILLILIKLNLTISVLEIFSDNLSLSP